MSLYQQSAYHHGARFFHLAADPATAPTKLLTGYHERLSFVLASHPPTTTLSDWHPKAAFAGPTPPATFYTIESFFAGLSAGRARAVIFG